MITVQNLLKTLHVVSSYYDNIDVMEIYCFNDIIAIERTDRPLTPEDFNTLIDLGWWQREDDDRTKYDPSQSWKHYGF